MSPDDAQGRPAAGHFADTSVSASEIFRAQLQGFPLPTYIWRHLPPDDYELIDYNDAAVEISGGNVASLLGGRASQLYADQPDMLPYFHDSFRQRRPMHREMTYRLLSTGETHRFRVTYVFVPPDLLMIHTEDVTARWQAEQAYRNLVERIPAVTYSAEPGADGEWQFVSPQIEALLGWPPEEWIADPTLWSRSVHPDDRERLFAEEERCAVTGDPLAVEYRVRARDGSERWLRDEGLYRTLPSGKRVIEGVITDISEQKDVEQRLQHLAEHDALTGLVNRERLLREVGLAVRHARREGSLSCVVVLDVDNFKYVNDSLGHDVGDQLIVGIGQLLRDRLRESDSLARLGGDEFAVLLRGAARERGLVVAQDLVRAVRAGAARVLGQVTGVTVSAGVTAVDGSAPPEEVLAAADLAMYEAKRAGRDRAAEYDARLQAELDTHRSWAARIREALANDGFTLHRQPIVDLTTGAVSQYELLIRLRGAGGRVESPAEFLSVAERFGLIGEIDRWVARTTIGLLQRTPDVRLHMNISGRSIGDGQLAGLIAGELDRTGVDAARLVVELTETAAISNLELAREFAETLSARGCHLALDDFGSGFASFYYLKHMPFDHLKIDGEFVRHLTDSPVDQQIVRSMVAIGRSLGRRTFAEFVEDAATLELLRDYGVDFAQGYYIGRPEPLTDW